MILLAMNKISRFVAPVGFVDLWRAVRSSVGEIDDRCNATVAFGEAFTSFLGAGSALPAPSGRGALLAILHALNLPAGGEVVLPALTFHSVPQAIRRVGLRPVFVDIDPQTYCLDVTRLPAVLTSRTVAIVPTHLYGRACDLDAITVLAQKHGLAIIEDCAQACGGFYRGRRLGSIGDAAFFSFGSTKNLSALGAGMAVLRSPAAADRAREWLGTRLPVSGFVLAFKAVFALAMRTAAHPWVWRPLLHPLLRLCAAIGFDPIEAVTEEKPATAAGLSDPRLPHPAQLRLALLQLSRIDDANRRRERNGSDLLEQLQNAPGLGLPAPASLGENIFMSFPVRVKDRVSFRRRLLAQGVDSASGYMSVCPHLPEFADASIPAPAATEAVAHMVHLPVYPELEPGDMERIAAAVTEIQRGR